MKKLLFIVLIGIISSCESESVSNVTIINHYPKQADATLEIIGEPWTNTDSIIPIKH